MSADLQHQGQNQDWLDELLIGAMYHEIFLKDYRKHRNEPWYHLPEKVAKTKDTINRRFESLRADLKDNATQVLYVASEPDKQIYSEKPSQAVLLERVDDSLNAWYSTQTDAGQGDQP